MQMPCRSHANVMPQYLAPTDITSNPPGMRYVAHGLHVSWQMPCQPQAAFAHSSFFNRLRFTSFERRLLAVQDLGPSATTEMASGPACATCRCPEEATFCTFLVKRICYTCSTPTACTWKVRTWLVWSGALQGCPRSASWCHTPPCSTRHRLLPGSCWCPARRSHVSASPPALCGGCWNIPAAGGSAPRGSQRSTGERPRSCPDRSSPRCCCRPSPGQWPPPREPRVSSCKPSWSWEAQSLYYKPSRDRANLQSCSIAI